MTRQLIDFRSLWPSLRQTIIEEIHKNFPEGAFYDSYLPVKTILELSNSTLKSIMEENAKIWNVEDEIPGYLLRYKRENPEVAIDPDDPPPQEVVRAIKYLKQMHLPGTLLGEWQFPLPDLEVFRPPMMFPAAFKSRLESHNSAKELPKGQDNDI
jgi:hypothetical protein